MASTEANSFASPRKLVIMRHAERVDINFGVRGAWMSSAFDKKGSYIRRDLNMPRSLPLRKGGLQDFLHDSPLTEIGHFQARLTGEGIKDCGMEFSHVFSSPALRCVETCASALKGAGQEHLPINVEPGLFEVMSFYKDELPVWMEVDDFKNNGFNVSKEYHPIIPSSSMPSVDESVADFYERNYFVTRQILQRFSGNLLFVAHAGSLDACSCQLTGKPRRAEEQALAYDIPFAGVVVVEEDSEESWHLVDPPFPILTHSSNKAFEWRQFL